MTFLDIVILGVPERSEGEGEAPAVEETELRPQEREQVSVVRAGARRAADWRLTAWLVLQDAVGLPRAAAAPALLVAGGRVAVALAGGARARRALRRPRLALAHPHLQR